jgi:hypothetical protein
MTISNSQLFFLKYSLLIESIVLPIPFSSFKVGRMTLIFRLNHSRKKEYIQKESWQDDTYLQIKSLQKERIYTKGLKGF